ncbi:MAG: hypothetical protein S4CHLAM20_07080 [Chlamydiia bacterium]|nr:hypothetical protein [Chlamydiia bacterium]
MSLTASIRHYFLKYNNEENSHINIERCEDHTGSALTLLKMEGEKFSHNANGNQVVIKPQGVSRLGRAVACFFLSITHILESLGYTLIDAPLTLLKKVVVFLAQRIDNTYTPEQTLKQLRSELQTLGKRVANLGQDFVQILSYPFIKNN